MSIVLCALVVLVLLPCLVLVGTWMFHLRSAANICEMIGTLGTGSTGQFSLTALGECDECRFVTRDGLTLHGTYVRGRRRPRRGVVVFCHEFGGDRHVAAPYTSGLLDEGFDVFTFDFRNHGQSEHMVGYTPRTWATQYEVNDVLAAIEYVRSRDDADPEGIALIGLSRGGSAAMSAASRADGVWALVTDGAFVSRWVTTANIRRFMPQFVRLAPVLTRLPWPIHAIYGAVVHDLVAHRVRHPCINLAADVPQLHPPLMMIHGARDSTIPVELAQRLWRRLPRRSRLWIVPKSNHNRSLRSNPARYQQRVGRFLKSHAPRPEPQASSPPSGNMSRSTISYARATLDSGSTEHSRATAS